MKGHELEFVRSGWRSGWHARCKCLRWRRMPGKSGTDVRLIEHEHFMHTEDVRKL